MNTIEHFSLSTALKTHIMFQVFPVDQTDKNVWFQLMTEAHPAYEMLCYF